MAGTSTVAYDGDPDRPGDSQRVRKITVDWVSDAADGTCNITLKKIAGKIRRIQTNPGSPAPTTLYDIVINDDQSYDVAAGLLANRHATNTETVDLATSTPSFPDGIAVCGILTIAITNAGNSKVGAIIITYDV